MSGNNWVYKVTVPAEKTGAFLDAMVQLGLIDDDDALEVLSDPDDQTEGE